MRVLLKRTAVGDSRFANLGDTHRQVQVLSLEMASAQVMETSVTNSSSFKNDCHVQRNNVTLRTTHNPRFKPPTVLRKHCLYVLLNFRNQIVAAPQSIS